MSVSPKLVALTLAPPPVEPEVLDSACDIMFDDGDVTTALDEWTRRLLSDTEFLERMTFLREVNIERARRALTTREDEGA